MTRMLIIFVLVGAAALAQAQTKSTKKQTQPPVATGKTQTSPATNPAVPPQKADEKAAEVPPDQPVITIRGLCPADAPAHAGKDSCVTTVTREQFDNLLKAFNPTNQPVPLSARRKLADAYVEILTFSEAAKKVGAENTPAFMEVMRVLRLRTLSDLYRRSLEDQYRKPSQQEIEAYYNANQSHFESAKLRRVFLPKDNPAAANGAAAEKEEYAKKVAQLADTIQERAAKGEDIEKLQKEAYTTLGITSPPPSTDIGNLRHGMLPPKLDEEVFSRKAGEVIKSGEASGYVIYRVESREAPPLDTVKEEIATQIFRTKLEEKTKEITSTVHSDLDEKYFGPPVPPAPAVKPPVPKPTK